LPQKCDRLFKYGHAPCSGLPNGCYSTHIDLRPGTHLVRVPGELPDSVAAPANCALATMVAATEALPTPCNVAVIQGAGLLGIYGCALLRGKGVRRVIMVDTDPRRLELVPKFGGEPVLETARQRLSRGEADAVFEVAGVPAVIGDALAVLRPGGFYGLVGMVHPQSALDITGEAIIRGCVTLRGFHNYAPRHLDAAIEFLRQEHKTFPWAELVSPPWPLARLDEAFAEAAGRRWHRVAVAP
jgi:threonine dehydrogenase-like Zn-dependent dehydrogenase